MIGITLVIISIERRPDLITAEGLEVLKIFLCVFGKMNLHF